jgi:hypothetical protein
MCSFNRESNGVPFRKRQTGLQIAAFGVTKLKIYDKSGTEVARRCHEMWNSREALDVNKASEA